jgi:NADPH:quinone reductase-like Zn-dependent oxidoreductase
MQGGTVSEVIASNNERFALGDIVLGHTGWQTHAVGGKGLRKLDPKEAPVSTALGVLGMPGMTAYSGLLEIGKPQPGETVVVAAASGAVGALVGQIARIKGARAVGIAGGPQKCGYVKNELGFDDCLDHRAPDLAGRLAAACPDGIDVYFENVGGAVFDGAASDARDADQAANLPGLHRQRLRRPPRRFPAQHVGLAARGPHQVPRGRDRRPGTGAAGADRALARRKFRQAADPGRAVSALCIDIAG